MRKEEYCKDDRSPVTDEPLWDTFRSTGSRRVFRELFMSWYSDLSRYAAYWLPDMSDAEEVVLDFFMHLWLHRTAVNISSTFKGYALMSVRNRCISKLRGGNMVFVGVEDIDPLSCLYVQDELSVEDASRIVWEAVASLPQKSREVFEKRNEGMSNAEIAASMNLSVKTVEGHITRSLKAIRVALKKYFFLFLF